MSSSGEKRKFASRRRSKKKFRGRRPGESDDHETVEFDQPVEGEEVRDLVLALAFYLNFTLCMKRQEHVILFLCYISSAFFDQC